MINFNRIRCHKLPCKSLYAPFRPLDNPLYVSLEKFPAPRLFTHPYFRISRVGKKERIRRKGRGPLLMSSTMLGYKPHNSSTTNQSRRRRSEREGKRGRSEGNKK